MINYDLIMIKLCYMPIRLMSYIMNKHDAIHDAFQGNIQLTNNSKKTKLF